MGDGDTQSSAEHKADLRVQPCLSILSKLDALTEAGLQFWISGSTELSWVCNSEDLARLQDFLSVMGCMFIYVGHRAEPTAVDSLTLLGWGLLVV